jgi:ethylbenzene dioxygenase beta subunit
MLLDLDFDVSTDDLRAVNVSHDTRQRVEQYLFHEARLLDQRRLNDWLALWTVDGMYWIPQQHDQKSPYDHVSLAWEDKMLREVRVRRVDNPRNWSQQPITRTSRLVGNVSIAGRDAQDCLVVHSVFQLTEWHNARARQLAGSLTHKLAADGDGWKLHFKRVDLVNCDAVHENLQIFI